MNRGPFLHGMARFAAVNNKNNRRYKPVSRRRKIVNLIFLLLGVAIVVVVFALGLGQIFMVGAAFFLGVASVPLLMSMGKNMVIYEAHIASNQKRAEMPLDFNKKRAVTGYILMFAPLYILMLACFFFPAHDAWIVPYIPLFVVTAVSAALSLHTVEAMDFSVKKYKWIHVLLYIGIFIVGALIRIFVMYPWIDAHT